LARGDADHVSATLLKADSGINTGPIFGFYTYPYDEIGESHVVIQNRVVLDNLDAIRDKLLEIDAGQALPIETVPKTSAEWGAAVAEQILALEAEGQKDQAPQ